MSIEQKFAPTITNEQTATLPAIRFEGKVQIVDTEQGLIEACNYLSQHSVIGFDTETRPSFKAGITNRVALIQLSTPERCYLFRLCRMKFGRELQRLLENPDIKKVGADVAGDIRSLNQLRHIRAAGFIDLQTIAPQWGIEEKSLRKLSAIVLGKRVSKAQRLSNWEAAQFTEQQISYAATDAWVCLEILSKLEATPKCNPAPAHEIKAQAEPQKIEQKAEQKAKSRHRPFRRRKPHNSKPTTETKE
ncbi:MAG: 3'-5' exonuclease domain-containing protein 2 [Rikenellaceae bacterium]|nr:3'-5' exonuclease domain-containing protein 2 [Rikenellaceae bacterium]